MLNSALSSIRGRLAWLAAGRWNAIVVFMALCTLGLAGCNRGPAVAQISGKVLLKDGSVPRGGVCAIKFEPTEKSTAEVRKAASGNIKEDGSFEMSTRKPGDGVFHGEYNVTFTVWKAPREPISLIDEKYTRSATTPYHVTIDGDRDDLFFEIE